MAFYEQKRFLGKIPFGKRHELHPSSIDFIPLKGNSTPKQVLQINYDNTFTVSQLRNSPRGGYRLEGSVTFGGADLKRKNLKTEKTDYHPRSGSLIWNPNR